MSGVGARWRGSRLGRIVVAGGIAGSVAIATSGASPASAAGGLIVSEVAPWGSGSSPYAADWFELTNTSGASMSVTGWKVDDDSNSSASAVVLNGVATLAAGESAIFMETSSAATVTSFRTFWSLPASVQVGTYSGSGIGLSTSGDAVNIFSSANALLARVTFGASPGSAPFASFDNAAGIDGAAISTLSVAGTNGAHLVPTPAAQAAVGSPGTIVSTTPPSSTSSTSTTTTLPPTSALPWPGDTTVVNASTYAFGSNLSGLIEEPSGTSAPGVLWAVKNGPGTLYRLVWDGANWTPDTGDWSAGKALLYPNGTTDPDSEGVTFTAAGPSSGIYVSTERNNNASSTSRLSILRFDPSAAGTSLTANAEWNLTADIPTTGANLGLEGITWVPDSYLTANGFRDSLGGAYNPATYPNHGNGLFFVGVEGTGIVYAYALDLTGSTFTRVASFSSGFAKVMELQFDRDLNELWTVCDDSCTGNVSQQAILRLNPSTGTFAAALFERPAGMPIINNEGFAIAPTAECVGNRKPVYWSDDNGTGGVSIRKGNIPCLGGTPPVVPEFPLSVIASISAVVLLGLTVLVVRRRSVPRMA